MKPTLNPLLALVVLMLLTSCGQIRKMQQSSPLPVEEIESKSGKPSKRRKLPKRTVPLDKNLADAPSKDKPMLYKYHKKQDGRSEADDRTVDDQRAAQVVQAAETYLGVPYRWGGMSAQGVDCSGLMVLAFKSAGLTLPRVSGDQATAGRPVTRNALSPGDLLFFASGQPGVIGHSALVVRVKSSSVQFIHATSGHGVRKDYLEDPHWAGLFITARRYW